MSASTSNRGRSLEDVIDKSQRGVVCLSKMYAQVRWFRGKGPTPVAGAVDYIGEVCRNGRAMHFDAKQTNRAAGFYVEHYLKPHQREHLLRHGQSKAIAGVLIECTVPEVGLYFWLPWQKLMPTQPPVVRWDDDSLVELGSNDTLVDFERIPGVAA